MMALAACDRPQLEQLAQNDEALIGDISGPEDNGIVRLKSRAAATATSPAKDWICSGTLVAPNLVITARHCITSFVEGTWNCDANGNMTSTDGSGQMGALDDPAGINVMVGVGPDLVTSAKGTAIFTPQVSNVCVNDIALVVLDTALTDLPIKPIRLTTPTFPGERYRAVGYGFPFLGADAGSLIRHTRSGVPIAKVGPSPLRPTGDAIPPRTFQSQGAGLCLGDSGGPALSDSGAVIGVFSEYAGSCTAPDSVETHTQIAPFIDAIVLPAFQAAGYEPWLEGNSEPGLYGTGGAGTGGATSAGGASLTGGGPPTGGSSSATGGATSAPVETGGAPLGTGGDTSVVVYDQGPAPGGTCACRASSVRYRGWGAALFASAALLGFARRRR